MQTFRDTDQYIFTTLESGQIYGHNHPYAHLIQDPAALAVDTHFTYSTSMVQQARLWLRNARAKNYFDVINKEWKISRNNPMSVEQAFHLITRAGGLALRRDDLGVIREGAKADLVVFRTDRPNMFGWRDPLTTIILHSDVGGIEDVLVDGKFVERRGKLVFPDYDIAMQRFAASAKRIQDIWSGKEWPRPKVFSKNCPRVQRPCRMMFSKALVRAIDVVSHYDTHL